MTSMYFVISLLIHPLLSNCVMIVVNRMYGGWGYMFTENRSDWEEILYLPFYNTYKERVKYLAIRTGLIIRHTSIKSVILLNA